MNDKIKRELERLLNDIHTAEDSFYYQGVLKGLHLAGVIDSKTRLELLSNPKIKI